MKFVVEFVNGSGTYIGGLELLDMARELVPDVAAERIPNALYFSGRTKFELTEEEARDSGCFEKRCQIEVKVVASEAEWATLARVEQVRVNDKTVEPIFSHDRALLDAWVMSDYACKFSFPYELEEDQE